MRNCCPVIVIDRQTQTIKQIDGDIDGSWLFSGDEVIRHRCRYVWRKVLTEQNVGASSTGFSRFSRTSEKRKHGKTLSLRSSAFLIAALPLMRDTRFRNAQSTRALAYQSTMSVTLQQTNQTTRAANFYKTRLHRFVPSLFNFNYLAHINPEYFTASFINKRNCNICKLLCYTANQI